MAGVIGAVVGALIAGAFGLLVAITASRRDHIRWLRQQRLEASVAFLAVTGEMAGSQARLRGLVEMEYDENRAPRNLGPTSLQSQADLERRLWTRLNELGDEAALAVARIQLLGPESLVGPATTPHRDATLVMVSQELPADDAAHMATYVRSRAVFLDAAREALHL